MNKRDAAFLERVVKDKSQPGCDCFISFQIKQGITTPSFFIVLHVILIVFSTFLPDFLKGSNVAKQFGENVKTSHVFIAMKCGKMCTFPVIFMYILNLYDY